MMNVRPLKLGLDFNILYYASGLSAMMLWSAGTPSMFRMLCPSEVGYERVHAAGGRWSSGPLCGIHSGDPSEHGRNAAGMRTERMGSPLGDPMNCFFR